MMSFKLFALLSFGLALVGSGASRPLPALAHASAQELKGGYFVTAISVSVFQILSR